MNQEILKMPKVELHCHLDGSLTLASVREILGKDCLLYTSDAADDA